MATFDDVEPRLSALIKDHNFICTYDDTDSTKVEVYHVRGAYGFCPVDGKPLAYNEATYCGAGCAAKDGS